MTSSVAILITCQNLHFLPQDLALTLTIPSLGCQPWTYFLSQAQAPCFPGLIPHPSGAFDYNYYHKSL